MGREIEADGDLLLAPVEAQFNRWHHEAQKLKTFPAFALLGSRDGDVKAAEGALDTQAGNTYGIRVELSNYPYSLPKIFPKGWTPHPATPHRFNDGSLCIMRSTQWRTHFTVALVVAKTAIWLGKYEIWKRNGQVWPGLQQRH